MTTQQSIIRRNGASSVLPRTSPKPSNGEVILAPEMVSLCGTDTQMLRGIRGDPSPILGHEGACQVVDVGSGVTDVNVGQRVMVNPTNPHDPSFLLGHNIEGLFQQRVKIPAPAVRAGLLIPLDADIPSDLATLIEPVGVVTYALDCLEANSRTGSLVIIGDGLIGNLAAVLAEGRQAWSHVVLVHSSEGGRSWSSSQLSAPSVQHLLNDELYQLAEHMSCSVLVATHRDKTVHAVDHAATTLRSAVGAFHLIGGVATESRSSVFPSINLAGVRAVNTGGPRPPAFTTVNDGESSVVFTGNRGVSRKDLLAAAQMVRTMGGSLRSLLTHQVDLAEGAELMNRMIAAGGPELPEGRVVRLVVRINPDNCTPDASVRISNTGLTGTQGDR